MIYIIVSILIATLLIVYLLSTFILNEVKDLHAHLGEMEMRLTDFIAKMEKLATKHRTDIAEDQIAKDQKDVTKQIKRQVDAKEIP